MYDGRGTYNLTNLNTTKEGISFLIKEMIVSSRDNATKMNFTCGDGKYLVQNILFTKEIKCALNSLIIFNSTRFRKGRIKRKGNVEYFFELINYYNWCNHGLLERIVQQFEDYMFKNASHVIELAVIVDTTYYSKLNYNLTRVHQRVEKTINELNNVSSEFVNHVTNEYNIIPIFFKSKRF